MKRLIALAKNLRKQQYLERKYQHQYAFVGLGSHSINNLYPVLSYLGVPLKYIVTRSEGNAKAIDKKFQGITGTNDFNRVLADEAVKGIFICASPSSHFPLVKMALGAEKNVFIEKPPCETSEQLEALILAKKEAKANCLVGLQKRYAPAYLELKRQMRNIASYNLKFQTGSYPEGNPITDLFIHPLDLAVYLFGPCSIESKQVVRQGKALSIFLHLRHGEVLGNLELSTNYSWSAAKEELEVNSKRGIYRASNCESLIFEKKSGTIFSLPKEKILPIRGQQTVYFNKNSFQPILAHNEIYSSGYFGELETFVKICESEKTTNRSELESVRMTFHLLDQLSGLNESQQISSLHKPAIHFP